ncbi:MAG: GGDEF domain-containing protein [Planctomycetota bacterium]|jgi:diguanylate cyclase
MEPLGYIAPWVLTSVGVGVLVGFFVGRGRHSVRETQLARLERQATLKVLVDLLHSAEQMTSDVECHNSEIQQTADHVGNLPVSGEMKKVKQALMTQIAGILESNGRLQDDLVYARYQMEEQTQQIDQARREARTDPLTNVSNRMALDEKFHLLHATWEREGHPYVLILADLDQFKRINDSHGHQAGDFVLERVGTGLGSWVREGDFVGRYGGDEFAILLPHTELTVGLHLAETIRGRTADETSGIAVRGEQVSVSMSMGVASPTKGDTTDSVLQRADRALYESKRLGRNQVTCQHLGQEAAPSQGVVITGVVQTPDAPSPTAG